MKQVIVIPARMGGTRLPGKPLIKICGQTLIMHVFNQCQKVVDKDSIYVATEDVEIVDYCKENNINVVNTGKASSAINRIKLFSDIVEADSYINVQGDEPIVNPEDIKSILKYSKEFPERVVFGKTNCNKEAFNDFSKAKVVCSLSGKLLYSSRAGIPLSNKGKYVSSEKAIWIYAFNKENLNKYFNTTNIRKLQHLEDNEIIGFLEIDVPVYCTDLIGDSWAVDEEKDIEIVENIIEKRKGLIQKRGNKVAMDRFATENFLKFDPKKVDSWDQMRNLERQVSRYKLNATRILKNVCRGEFPGKYTS